MRSRSLFFAFSFIVLFAVSFIVLHPVQPKVSLSRRSGPRGPVGHLMPAAHWGFVFSFTVLFAVSFIVFFAFPFIALFTICFIVLHPDQPQISICLCSGPWAQGPLGPVGHLMPAAHWDFVLAFIVLFVFSFTVLFAVSFIVRFAVSFIVRYCVQPHTSISGI